MTDEEQPSLPFAGSSTRNTTSTAREEIPPGFVRLRYADGRTRVARGRCVVEDCCVKPCWQLEDVMDWFGPDSVTQVTLGAIMRVHTGEEGVGAVIRHGRKRCWAQLLFCPFCGSKIDNVLPSRVPAPPTEIAHAP